MPRQRVLHVEVEAHQVEAVGDHAEEQDAQQRPRHVRPRARVQRGADEHGGDRVQEIGAACERRELAEVGRQDHPAERAGGRGGDERGEQIPADADARDLGGTALQADGMDALAVHRTLQQHIVDQQHHGRDDDLGRDAEDVADGEVAIALRRGSERDRAAAVGVDPLDAAADEQHAQRGQERADAAGPRSGRHWSGRPGRCPPPRSRPPAARARRRS